jgi:hypothetical protein
MKLYYFTTFKNAENNIKTKHIKISLLKDLNDPYEVSALISKRNYTKELIHTDYLFSQFGIGLICFSSNYDCPLMWAHYAEKHKGVCLVFDVNKDNLFRVNYSNKLVKFNRKRNLTYNDAVNIASTKYYKWNYEREYRKFVKLESSKFDNNNKFYFESFSEDIKLVEVILGYKIDDHKLFIEMWNYPVFKAALTNNFKIKKKPFIFPNNLNQNAIQEKASI